MGYQHGDGYVLTHSTALLKFLYSRDNHDADGQESQAQARPANSLNKIKKEPEPQNQPDVSPINQKATRTRESVFS